MLHFIHFFFFKLLKLHIIHSIELFFLAVEAQYLNLWIKNNIDCVVMGILMCGPSHLVFFNCSFPWGNMGLQIPCLLGVNVGEGMGALSSL